MDAPSPLQRSLRASRPQRCANPDCHSHVVAVGVPPGWLSVMQAHPSASPDAKTALSGLGFYCSVTCLRSALEILERG